jgi:hypothetical protein
MSELQDIIATSSIRAFNSGIAHERAEVIKSLQGYLALTQEPDLAGEVEVNEEWDRGFQAAISIVANTYNQRSRK